MKIDRMEIARVAALARLRISDEEADRLAAELDGILTYMDKLAELDTTGIEPMAHALTLATPYRDDEVRDSLDPEDTLTNAPARQGTFFQVPKVI